MCLSFFTGCSLFVKKDTVDNTATALKIGDTVITKQELIDSYYNFYQQNYYYFMYYDEETIMKVFYDSVIAREIVLAEANKMLAENPKFFSDKDMEDLWRKLSALLKDRQMERPVFTLQMSQYEKRFFPYLASRFNAISVKVPTGFLHRTQQAERKRRIIRML